MNRKLILKTVGISGATLATLIAVPTISATLISPNFSKSFFIDKKLYCDYIRQHFYSKNAQYNGKHVLCSKTYHNDDSYDFMFSLQKEICDICNQLDLDIPKFSTLINKYCLELCDLIKEPIDKQDDSKWHYLTKCNFELTRFYESTNENIARLILSQKRLDELIAFNEQNQSDTTNEWWKSKIIILNFLKERISHHIDAWQDIMKSLPMNHSQVANNMLHHNISLFSKLSIFKFLEYLFNNVNRNNNTDKLVTNNSNDLSIEYLTKMNNNLLNEKLKLIQNYESKIKDLNDHMKHNQEVFEKKITKEIYQQYNNEVDKIKKSIFVDFEEKVSLNVNKIINQKILQNETQIRSDLAIIHKKELDSVIDNHKKEIYKISTQSQEDNKKLLLSVQQLLDFIKNLQNNDKEKFDYILLFELENLILSQTNDKYDSLKYQKIESIINELSGLSQELKQIIKNELIIPIVHRNRLTEEFEEIVTNRMHQCFFTNNNKSGHMTKINFFKIQLAKILTKLIVKMDHDMTELTLMPSELNNFHTISKIRRIIWNNEQNLNEAVKLYDNLEGKIKESLSKWIADVNKYLNAYFIMQSLHALSLSKLKLNSQK